MAILECNFNMTYLDSFPEHFEIRLSWEDNFAQHKLKHNH